MQRLNRGSCVIHLDSVPFCDRVPVEIDYVSQDATEITAACWRGASSETIGACPYCKKKPLHAHPPRSCPCHCRAHFHGPVQNANSGPPGATPPWGLRFSEVACGRDVLSFNAGQSATGWIVTGFRAFERRMRPCCVFSPIQLTGYSLSEGGNKNFRQVGSKPPATRREFILASNHHGPWHRDFGPNAVGMALAERSLPPHSNRPPTPSSIITPSLCRDGCIWRAFRTKRRRSSGMPQLRQAHRNLRRQRISIYGKVSSLVRRRHRASLRADGLAFIPASTVKQRGRAAALAAARAVADNPPSFLQTRRLWRRA